MRSRQYGCNAMAIRSNGQKLSGQTERTTGRGRTVTEIKPPLQYNAKSCNLRNELPLFHYKRSLRHPYIVGSVFVQPPLPPKLPTLHISLNQSDDDDDDDGQQVSETVQYYANYLQKSVLLKTSIIATHTRSENINGIGQQQNHRQPPNHLLVYLNLTS